MGRKGDLMKNKKTFLIISCLVGLISAVGYMSRIQSVRTEIANLTEMAPILTVSSTVKAGERLDPANLTAIMIPRESLSRRALSPEDVDLISNRRALHTIPAGDPILWTDLPEGPRLRNPSERVPPGLRAFALPADETHTMIHFLSPDDRVDILSSSYSDSTGRLVTSTVAKEIRVLSIGNNMESWNRDEEETAYPLSVTLLAEPDVAASILKASQTGEIHFLVRGRDIFSGILNSATSAEETNERAAP
jgi:Flp pilus assembly protein CpaB